MAKDSAARVELGRSFHQVGTVNVKVCESDFVPLWDHGTIMHRSLAERKLLEAHTSEVLNLGKEVQSQRWLNINALNFMRAAIGSQCKLMWHAFFSAH